jgi:formate dehydrogenase subunit gamma
MRQTGPRRLSSLGAFLVALGLVLGATLASGLIYAAFLDRPALAQRAVDQPSNARGGISPSDEWRLIRRGIQGDVSLPDKQAGVLVQSQGQSFREWRNGPLSTYGVWAIVGMLGLLAAFYGLRGRIGLDSGWSGRLIERFSSLERFTHWMTATSFVILGLSGLNMLYGRYVLLPVIGPSAFSWLTRIGKISHDYLSFAFMLGIVLMLVLWARENIPNRVDWQWLRQGGGMLKRGLHPPADKFNAGQKILFWLVILAGLSVSLSGIALLFPFTFSWFSGTFAALNLLGLGLPTDLTPLQETQLSELWHAAVALLFIAVIIAHVYIGTLGMEGAFDAMGTGKVDRNWAAEHHKLWLAKIDKQPAGSDD